MNEKIDFVENELTECAKAIDSNVDSLTYEVCIYSGFERVTVNYSNGYNRHVDVSADSLLSTALDVLKKLA